MICDMICKSHLNQIQIIRGYDDKKQLVWRDLGGIIEFEDECYHYDNNYQSL